MWYSRLVPVIFIILIAAIALPGCEAAPRNHQAIRAYYDHDYSRSREALRADAYEPDEKHDEQVLLDNLRLGMAALADGDTREAERALGTSWELLSTAGLNADRTTAAILVHEGVRIWKGEPFEQALAYHYVATLYAVLGDWENARAAAANALFRLTDFGADQTTEQIARRAARNPGSPKQGYTAVDTDFALGFLMQATASEIADAPGAREQFAAALKIEPRLAPLVKALRARQFDTLLIVDYGKGPTKIAYGPDGSLARFEPQEPTLAPLGVRVDGRRSARASPVCDVNRMARDHRWNNLEDVRRAKSAVGDALVFGGTVVALSGSPYEGPGEALVRALIGAGMWGAGLLTKSGARADTRYLEFAPQAIYLVPLRLRGPREVTLTVENGSGATEVLPEVVPGTDRKPRAIYVRMHAGSGAPASSRLARASTIPTHSTPRPSAKEYRR